MSELLSGEVAKLFDVHPITIGRRAKAGKIPFRLNQHGWKIFDEELMLEIQRKRSGKNDSSSPMRTSTGPQSFLRGNSGDSANGK